MAWAALGLALLGHAVWAASEPTRPSSMVLGSDGHWEQHPVAPSVVRRQRATAGRGNQQSLGSAVPPLPEDLEEPLLDPEHVSEALLEEPTPPPTQGLEDWEDENKYPNEGDKVTEVKNPAKSDSERIKAIENNFNCMDQDPVGNCMEKYGSYGVRRLQEVDVNSASFKRDFNYGSWMSHDEVQKQRLFSVTLPGSHVSASYGFVGEHEYLGRNNPYGIQMQKHSIKTQLEMGIRFFDILCAWSFLEKKVYASYGLMLMPLEKVMDQISDHLKSNRKEVVVFSLRKAKSVARYDYQYIERLVNDENSTERIPGETVHYEVKHTLGQYLTTHLGLSFLKEGANRQDPTIADLVEANRRVVYLWEGQQVLCLDRTSCSRTPGWLPPVSDLKTLSFGPPMPMGMRAKFFKDHKDKVIEPSCLQQSWVHTKTARPEKLIRGLFNFCRRLRESVTLPPLPACFPPLTAVPGAGLPPLFYEASAIVSMTPEEFSRQQLILQNKAEVWRSGEAYTKSSDAERVNFLLLTWFMKKGNSPIYLKPNFITMDYPHPVVVERIIHAVQKRPECGFAIFCKETGSCWAKSLLTKDKKTGEIGKECLKEHLVSLDLMWESGILGFWDSVGGHALIFLSIIFGIPILFLLCIKCCGLRAKPKMTMTGEGLFLLWAWNVEDRRATTRPSTAPPQGLQDTG